jgi:hypothetical protein
MTDTMLELALAEAAWSARPAAPELHVLCAVRNGLVALPDRAPRNREPDAVEVRAAG